jgi:2,4-dienoyl-CoA reductase-like NADH-dependent reductase (Old Yellow Enzyme family)
MLLDPLQLNQSLRLKNRIIMAPMTRSMCDEQLVPTKLMRDYYARRADAGLIVSEGIIIRPDGQGYPNVPGIYTKKQIEAWREITDAVHQNGGLIFAQIWHAGRVSHPIYLKGDLPLSPSATKMTGLVKRGNGLRYGQARAATRTELAGLIDSFVIAAENARLAGFDGIEFHGANGYLIDQFLHHSTNQRDDEYGKTPEGMANFVIKMTKAVADAIGSDRVAIRLTPAPYIHEIEQDDRDKVIFKYLLSELNQLKLAYLHTGAYEDSQRFTVLENLSMTEFLRRYYTGHLIASGGYDRERAEDILIAGIADAVAFGRAFIANPDLVMRIQTKQSWETYHNSMLDSLY